MDISVQKCRAFVEAARLGSFTRAAAVLECSQSGVSRMIADLEKDWGVALLERGRGGVRVTSDGAQLLPFAQAVCDGIADLQTQIDQVKGMESGIIRIGTFSSVATHRLPKIIKEFQKDFPGIDYELLMGDYAEIESWVADGRVDIGFRPVPTTGSFHQVIMERDQMLVALPEDHPLAGRPAFPVEALADYPFMALERDDGAGVSEVARIFDAAGIPMHARFTTWDDYAIMSMVEQGLGIAILPALILQRCPYRIATRPLSQPAFRDIALIMRDRDRASLATRHFLEYLKYW